MSLSIRWRLTASIVVAILFTVAVILLTLRFALERVVSDDLDGRLSADSRQIETQLATVGSLDRTAIREILAPVTFEAVVRDAQGDALATTPGFDPDGFALTAEDLARVMGGAVLHQEEPVRGELTRIRTERVEVAGEIGLVQVGETASHLKRVVDALELALIAEGLGALALAAVTGYWLGRIALQPVDDVVGLAREIEATDLGRRLEEEHRPAEIRRLAHTFNAMLERLSRAFEQQREFVMDVSHELRTPLTALRGTVEVLLMDDRLDSETRAQLERLSAELERLTRLVANLVYLANADVGRAIERRAVELDALCWEVEAQAKSLRPGVVLRTGHHEQISVEGDRDLLKQVVLNLVDNGMKYTHAGGRVTLSVYRDGETARIEVVDTGPGIPPDELARIFDRYFQGRRTGGRHAGGLGIGLAISEWIVREHGGTLEVESEVGKGSKFTVRLPAIAAV